MTFSFRHEHTISPRLFLQFTAVLAFWLLSGCAGVKNPPLNTPYAYNNDVEVTSNQLNTAARNLLSENLLNYLDDSLQVQTVSVFGRTRRINPPIFDSINIQRSIRFMEGYLNSLGYYNASFDSFLVKKDDLRPNKPEIRVSTTFFITLGKSLRVNELTYQFRVPLLQKIADSVKSKSQIAPGTLYSKDQVAAELERLAGVFRQSGFLKINRSLLLAEVDTTDPTLIGFEPDPVRQMISSYQRLEDPIINLNILQRPGTDSSGFLQYTIDSVIIYPETRVDEDLNGLISDSTFQVMVSKQGVILKTRYPLFTQKTILNKNLLRPGKLYDEADYFKTINNYSQMGPWQQVDTRIFTRIDSIPLADLHVFLFTAKKQTFQVDLEGSQNNNISVSNVLAGRFLALAFNMSHRNRNVFRRGALSTTTASFGLELNNTRSATNPNFFQTFIVNLGQSYSLPRLIKPFRFLDNRRQIDAGRTSINLNALYTERFRFFSQTSVSTNLQWEWRRGRNTANISIPNFETVFIDQFEDSLNKVIAQNPALRFAFTPGNILSVRTAFERSVPYKKQNHAGFYRVSGEFAARPGFTLFNNDFFTFFRLECQYVEGVKYKRSSIHYRMYGGVGWDISGSPGATLPFFRQFVAGGNNSMRAWRLRQLGLGNSLLSDTATFTDRFGDIQLETNVEYRFKLFRFFGYNLEGAAFADIGNIWNHKNNGVGNGQLALKDLYRDLAVGVGTGVRWDFGYLVIRLDAAFKVKDPIRAGDGWIREFEWKSFNRLGAVERSNLGFQFGIGYPF